MYRVSTSYYLNKEKKDACFVFTDTVRTGSHRFQTYKFNRNEEQNESGIVMMIHNQAVKIQCKTVISNVVQLYCKFM